MAGVCPWASGWSVGAPADAQWWPVGAAQGDRGSLRRAGAKCKARAGPVTEGPGAEGQTSSSRPRQSGWERPPGALATLWPGGCVCGRGLQASSRRTASGGVCAWTASLGPATGSRGCQAAPGDAFQVSDKAGTFHRRSLGPAQRSRGARRPEVGRAAVLGVAGLLRPPRLASLCPAGAAGSPRPT